MPWPYWSAVLPGRVGEVHARHERALQVQLRRVDAAVDDGDDDRAGAAGQQGPGRGRADLAKPPLL